MAEVRIQEGESLENALRRFKQTKIISAAAILTLALAVGACVTAFRLIKALLLIPLPVADSKRLFVVAFRSVNIDEHLFHVRQQLLPVIRADEAGGSRSSETDGCFLYVPFGLTYSSDDEMEKAFTQFVSGDMFAILV